MSDDEKYVELTDANGEVIIVPKYVIAFLQDLRKQDIEELSDSIQTIQTVKRGGRIMKWTAITLFVTVTSAVAFGNTLFEAKKLLFRFFTGN